MLLSLIIPFYGVEAYISECLEPLRALPEDLCEILLVDDCGTDRSCEIAAEFCSHLSNARLIRRASNGGLSAARNTGMDAANGDYIFFLDSDDIPQPENILSLARTASSRNVDVIMGMFQYLDDESGILTSVPQSTGTDILPGAHLFAEKSRAGTYEPMVWQCMYRREYLLAHGLRMTEGMLFEDELFTTPSLLLAQRTMYSPLILLNYRQRQGSIMSGFRNGVRWCECYLSICRQLRAFDSDHPTDASTALQERIARIALSLGKNIPAYGIEGQVRNDAISFLHRNREEIYSFTKLGRTLPLKLQSQMLYLAPKLFIQMYAAATKLSGH